MDRIWKVQFVRAERETGDEGGGGESSQLVVVKDAGRWERWEDGVGEGGRGEREREDPCELRNHKDSHDWWFIWSLNYLIHEHVSGRRSTGRQSLSSAPSLLLLSHVSSCHLLLLRLYFRTSCFQPASLRLCSVSLRPPAINISPAGFTTHTHQ